MKKQGGTGLLRVIQSALSAAIGVQKKQNLERDFTQGKPAHYIIAGVVGTVLFVAVLVFIVSLVTHSAQ